MSTSRGFITGSGVSGLHVNPGAGLAFFKATIVRGNVVTGELLCVHLPGVERPTMLGVRPSFARIRPARPHTGSLRCGAPPCIPLVEHGFTGTPHTRNPTRKPGTWKLEPPRTRRLQATDTPGSMASVLLYNNT